MHYFTSGFRDGSVISAGPLRRPSARKIKKGIDGVCCESFHSTDYWTTWELEQRAKAVTILVHRINTRRAIRELVLPALAEIRMRLIEATTCLERLERAVAELRAQTDAGSQSDMLYFDTV